MLYWDASYINFEIVADERGMVEGEDTPSERPSPSLSSPAEAPQANYRLKHRQALQTSL